MSFLFATSARGSCCKLPLLLLETMRGLMHDDSNLKALCLSLQRWVSFKLAQILLTVFCTRTEFGIEQVSSSFNCSEREKQLQESRSFTRPAAHSVPSAPSCTAAHRTAARDGGGQDALCGDGTLPSALPSAPTHQPLGWEQYVPRS